MLSKLSLVESGFLKIKLTKKVCDKSDGTLFTMTRCKRGKAKRFHSDSGELTNSFQEAVDLNQCTICRLWFRPDKDSSVSICTDCPDASCDLKKDEEFFDRARLHDCKAQRPPTSNAEKPAFSDTVSAVKLDQISCLKGERRSILPTAEAAFHLNRAPQTLRIWACRENGPIKPIRVAGRLGWRVEDILKLLEG